MYITLDELLMHTTLSESITFAYEEELNRTIVCFDKKLFIFEDFLLLIMYHLYRSINNNIRLDIYTRSCDLSNKYGLVFINDNIKEEFFGTVDSHFFRTIDKFITLLTKTKNYRQDSEKESIKNMFIEINDKYNDFLNSPSFLVK